MHDLLKMAIDVFGIGHSEKDLSRAGQFFRAFSFFALKITHSLGAARSLAWWLTSVGCTASKDQQRWLRIVYRAGAVAADGTLATGIIDLGLTVVAGGVLGLA